MFGETEGALTTGEGAATLVLDAAEAVVADVVIPAGVVVNGRLELIRPSGLRTAIVKLTALLASMVA